jgi:uncharacterized membrane protein YciS (DUF1049 family)
MDSATGGKVITVLGDTAGAVGVICGVLLVAALFFLRYLLQSLQTRDREMVRLNQEVQKALVNNTAAMTTLAQILQHRRCLANDSEVRHQINQVTNPEQLGGNKGI